MSWDTWHTILAKLTKNSNWVWHCTLPPVTSSATQPNFAQFPEHMMQQMIFNTYSPLPSGRVAQSVEQWWSILKGHGFNSHPGQSFSVSLLFLCATIVMFAWLCSISLGCQQDFGIYLLHGKGSCFSFTWKTDDAIFMESSASFLCKTINIWFIYIQSQGKPTRNDAQVDVWMYDSVLKPLIDSSGQTNLFITIIINKWKECEKA